MGKRPLRDPDDDLATVVLIDPRLRNSVPFATDLEDKLREAYAEAGTAKVCYKALDFPSVQWITKTRDDQGEIVLNQWKTEPFVLALIGANEFGEHLRQSTNEEELLQAVFRPSTDFLNGRQVSVLVFEERKKAGGGGVALERKRLEDEKAAELTTGCEVLRDVSFSLRLKADDCVSAVVRATKSILEKAADTSRPYSCDQGQFTWFPKKSGNPVAVVKNDSHTGLYSLWQKQLTQISKRLGIEQAKVITEDRRFGSPKALFETYEAATSSGGETLLQSKPCRPSGSSRDVQSHGAGQCLGPDTSKKVHHMFTVKGDGSTFL